MQTSRLSESAAPQAAFVTTRWTTVLAAGSGDTQKGLESLDRLCKIYWYPLYVYVRRRGYAVEDAQDLTQEFFKRLFDRRALAAADPARGRFRSFLLKSMSHFLAHEWEKGRALKRGGGHEVWSLDFASVERRYDMEPADDMTPDKIYDKQWALTMLNRVLDRLERECIQEGKGDWFATLNLTLAGARKSQPYAELAKGLHVSEGAIKVAVHRLRLRYRCLVREEIANTIENPADVEQEMKHLFAILAER